MSTPRSAPESPLISVPAALPAAGPAARQHHRRQSATTTDPLSDETPQPAPRSPPRPALGPPRHDPRPGRHRRSDLRAFTSACNSRRGSDVTPHLPSQHHDPSSHRRRKQNHEPLVLTSRRLSHYPTRVQGNWPRMSVSLSLKSAVGLVVDHPSHRHQRRRSEVIAGLSRAPTCSRLL